MRALSIAAVMKPAACFLPDGSGYPLNTVTLYDGQRYRCVEVFAPTELLTLQSDADGKTRTSRAPGKLKVQMAGGSRFRSAGSK